MPKFMNVTKVITGVNTRWSYANVWDPKSINGGAPKYSVSLIIPKSDTTTVEKIKAAIQAAYEEGESKLKGNITSFWWAVDAAVKEAVTMRTTTEVGNIRFIYKSAMLFIELLSGRRLAYVKPKLGENQFGGTSVTYEGVGSTKKWERIESYGPKFVENIVQAVSRDLLCFAMRNLSHCFICGHVHDELIIECREDASVESISSVMGRTPDWMPNILIRGDGYDTKFYKKD